MRLEYTMHGALPDGSRPISRNQNGGNMATIREVKILLEAVASDVAEIKKATIIQNNRVRKNENDIVRLQTWVSLVGGSELLAVVAFTALKLAGLI